MIDLLQWPGMLLGLVGAPLVASSRASLRMHGFAAWLVSNLCWIAWAAHAHAWGLVAMQLVFCASSAAGLSNNRKRNP